MEYKRVHKIWPPIKITGPISTGLKFSIDSNSWPYDKETLEPEEFKYIEILECLEFIWFLDCEALLVDKALAVGLNSWPIEYDLRYHKIKCQKLPNRTPKK